jgi:hypothetical protein
MKKILTCIIVSAITFFSSCENEQEISATQVSQPGMNAFQLKYPNVTPDKWVKETKKAKLFMKQNLKTTIKKLRPSSTKKEILLKKNRK